MAIVLPEPCETNHFLVAHVELLLSSFSRWTGRSLMDNLPLLEQAKQLFDAPFAVLSHSHDADPIFTYGNRTALNLFELSWTELTHLPSRLSAEPLQQADRERLLRIVAQQGYIDDYSGIRISRSGRRFKIEQAIVWNLVKDDRLCGQAAAFSHWTFLSN